MAKMQISWFPVSEMMSPLLLFIHLKSEQSYISHIQFFNVQLIKTQHLEFPGGPVVRTPCFHCYDLGSIPGQGTQIPQAKGCSQIYIHIYIVHLGHSQYINNTVSSFPIRLFNEPTLIP